MAAAAVIGNCLQELDEFGNQIPVPHDDSLIALARHILEVSELCYKIP